MFMPKRVLIEKDALKYPLGEELYNNFKNKDIELIMLETTRTKGIPGSTKMEKYKQGKNTLVIGVKKSLTFQTCKPSAHYQLPLVTGCIGQCEYCYLNTQLGDKPYTRIYVNIDEILDRAKKYINEREGEVTIFEGAATSDPLPVEPYTHALKKTIEFFAKEELGRFRFVTKFTNIEDIVNAKHNGHTTVRFSLNTDKVINTYEHRTPNAKNRIQAAAKVLNAGYPIGFIIAPVFLYDNWETEYSMLIKDLNNSLPVDNHKNITFEIISHRYTTKAKNRINDIFPETKLPMTDEERTFKYGQFGYGKYVYNKDQLSEMKTFFTNELSTYFSDSEIKYII
ncbi:spore photoproduct lyase [Vallitalea longa]|uniref:Spore photoproduct lyase n=2 Tax=Vallitalea longa TaxID=2936439 RepID=A0A9W5YFK3_9FIRM|nr:spore photoproduct lyase [Vallitalea longa]GKX30283.1 spore photoproduct lyase [Vallitalea longa]